MGLLERVKFAAWDNAGAVVDLIKKWVPGKCNTEKDHENSLYTYLHSELGSVQITKQFGHGRIKADLAVGEKVLLELKHNLDSTAKLQRLIGQPEGYRELDRTVVVLLTAQPPKRTSRKTGRDEPPRLQPNSRAWLLRAVCRSGEVKRGCRARSDRVSKKFCRGRSAGGRNWSTSDGLESQHLT